MKFKYQCKLTWQDFQNTRFRSFCPQFCLRNQTPALDRNKCEYLNNNKFEPSFFVAPVKRVSDKSELDGPYAL